MYLTELLHSLFWIFNGVLTGIIFGMIPGLGVLSAVSIFFVVLHKLDALNILLFYVGLIISIQFMGSVIATFFGVPGENTSLPASVVGHKLYKQGRGAEAIVLSASGSLFASISAVFVLWIMLFSLQDVYWIYSQKTYAFVFFSVLLYLVFFNSKIILNCFLVLFGLLLGAIGQNQIQSLSLIFNQSWLLPGLDLKIFILLAFSVPNLFIKYPQLTQKKLADKNYATRMLHNWKFFFRDFFASCRGTVVGMIAGLIPGVGTSVCSNIAWNIEKKFKKSNLSKQLLSAESANNSANISSLFPVIVLGLPILASEAIILNAMQTSAGGIGWNWFLVSQNGMPRIYWLFFTVVMVSILTYFIATSYAKKITKIVSQFDMEKIKIILPLSLLLFFVYLSWKDLTLLSSIFTMSLCFILAFFFITYRIDASPLVFSFLISKIFLQTLTIFFSL